MKKPLLMLAFRSWQLQHQSRNLICAVMRLPDLQPLLAATHGKWRNRWRHANKTPVTLRQERFDLTTHQWLLDADRAQQRQKRFRGLPHALIIELAAKQAVYVHVAYLGTTPLAAMLFIMHRPVVTYHLGWTNSE
ncbi:MAG: hypothetical protein ACJASZ_002814, partial [Yoonia sp.]